MVVTESWSSRDHGRHGVMVVNGVMVINGVVVVNGAHGQQWVMVVTGSRGRHWFMVGKGSFLVKIGYGIDLNSLKRG